MDELLALYVVLIKIAVITSLRWATIRNGKTGTDGGRRCRHHHLAAALVPIVVGQAVRRKC